MHGYDDATSALQLLMRRHDSTVWEAGDWGEIKIGIPVEGKGSPFELRPITPSMMAAAQKQIETGTPSLRGELDFEPPPPRHRSFGYALPTDSLIFESCGCALTLAEIYAGVDLPSRNYFSTE
jgi:hypothetical protein